MQNLLSQAYDLLKQDERLLSTEGDLLKNKIQELAYKLDEKLIGILLSDAIMKEKFFVSIKDVVVFDQKKFVQFINNKQFLPDSYTVFKNKIGLTDSRDQFISESNDVVLDRPYKDCILAGGQDKEDAKRDEIFYNEVLGSDQVDRLLDPKVFTNFKRYTVDGEQKIKGFTRDEIGLIKDNFIIKGNNLLALHSLKKQFKKSIKLIYIDPPYYFRDNKPEDSFKYNSNFKLSSWLTFMKNRLEIAKELLHSEGVVFVQIKDDGMAHLKLLMDDVFGSENFVNCIAIKMSEASGVKMTHAKSRFPNIKEFIFFYKKSNDFKGFNRIDKYKNKERDNENNIFLENFTQDDRNQLIAIQEKEDVNDEDVENAIKVLANAKKVSLTEKIKSLSKEIDTNEWLFENSYRIIKTAGSSSLAKQIKKLEKIPNQDISAFTSTDHILFYYITDFNRETKQPRLQVIFADENIWKNPCDFWQDIKTTGAIANERGVQLSGGKKPEKLLHRIIDMTTKEGDIVLDYHAGSGTTAGVAHKMKRQWITMEQIHSQIDLSLVGLNNVIAGDKTGISKAVDRQGGGEFVYMEIAQNNEKLIQAIHNAEYSKDLVSLYNQLKGSSFINYKVDIKAIDDNISAFEALSLENMKRFLNELIDKNALYINYSEMNDESYALSEEDKALNKQFYQ